MKKSYVRLPMEKGGEPGGIWKSEEEQAALQQTCSFAWAKMNIRMNNIVGILYCLKSEKSEKRRQSAKRNALVDTFFILRLGF